MLLQQSHTCAVFLTPAHLQYSHTQLLSQMDRLALYQLSTENDSNIPVGTKENVQIGNSPFYEHLYKKLPMQLALFF